jgi:stage II sporulation protein D
MKTAIALLALILGGFPVAAQDVRVGVLGLFHPRELSLSAPAGSALVVQTPHESVVLEQSSGVSIAEIHVSGDEVLLRAGRRTLRSSNITVTSRNNGPTDFNLSIAGKITRRYRGTLEVKSDSRVLVPVVIMDLETAVASVVAAEGAGDMPSEALEALAVASRSYFVAGKGRHRDFDFCDTTHCQFLREPPSDTAAAKAASSTRGLVITYQSQPIAPMYTRSCSGRTLTPAEVGLPPATYPYYSVDCKYCREHPSRWQTRLSAADSAALHNSDESSRLNLDRRVGWSAVPSNTFSMKKEGPQTVLHGVGQGHGIGLCQAGARSMAKEGADFTEILAHYYPNTVIATFAKAVATR